MKYLHVNFYHPRSRDNPKAIAAKTSQATAASSRIQKAGANGRVAFIMLSSTFRLVRRLNRRDTFPLGPEVQPVVFFHRLATPNFPNSAIRLGSFFLAGVFMAKVEARKQTIKGFE